MKVTYYFREYREGNFSIESIFGDVINGLSNKICAKLFFVKNKINVGSVFSAVFSQGDVNHITGDVNYLALFLKGKKTAVTVHDVGHYQNTLKGWKKEVYKYVWFVWPLKKVSKITAISEFTKAQLIQLFHIPAEKITVIHNAYSNDFKYCPREFNSIKPKILQIGSMHNKNLNRLIEAIDSIPCELILVRKPDLKIEALLKSKNITYAWFSNLTTQELILQYQNCDLVFFASVYEGFGMPIVEANAVGRPIIVGNVSAMPEIAGKAACIVDPFDVSSIKEGVCRIINDKEYRTHLVKEGLINIKRFEKDKILSQYFELYKSMIAS